MIDAEFFCRIKLLQNVLLWVEHKNADFQISQFRQLVNFLDDVELALAFNVLHQLPLSLLIFGLADALFFRHINFVFIFFPEIDRDK